MNRPEGRQPLRCRALLAVGILLPLANGAEAEFSVEPWIFVAELYDDNVYYSPEDELADYITRVTPGLTLRLESARTELVVNASLDAEAYHRNRELDSLAARKYADAGFTWRATRRLSFDAAVDYIETDTPFDLVPLTGGAVPGPLVGRSEAQRTSLSGSATYRMTPALDTTVALRQVDDELEGSGESRERAVEAFIDQRLSEQSVLSYGYLGRRFESMEEDAVLGARTATQRYHTPWAGLSHDFSERTTVAVRGGPAFGEDSTEPYVLASLKHATARGEWLMDYERSQTTLLGDAEVVQESRISVSYSHLFRSGLGVEFAPNYLSVSRSRPGHDVYTNVLLGATWPLNRAVLLTAGYELSRQRTTFDGASRVEIDHNVVHVGLRFSLPGNRTEDEEL